MNARSSFSNLISPLPNPETLIRQSNRTRNSNIENVDNMANPNIQIPPLEVNDNGAPQGPNLRPMEEMHQAPFDGVR